MTGCFAHTVSHNWLDFRATKREIAKSIGHGMVLKVFWGIIICQGLQTVKF